MAEDLRIIVLEGDETGQELLEQSLRVLGMDDRFHWGHYFLGWGHEAQGDTAAAEWSLRAMHAVLGVKAPAAA